MSTNAQQLKVSTEKMIDMCRVAPGRKLRLAKHDPAWAGNLEVPKAQRRRLAESLLAEGVAELAQSQELLYASDSWAILLIFQALDAAGKDGTIKHVMSGVNPQGCQVFSFKHPSAEELDHNFLWRCMKRLPERGRIGIFNRSYYEEVLIVRVHPELLVAQRIPEVRPGKELWQARYEDINHFEQHLVRNGTVVLKFFLHLSKEQQRRRFLKRVSDPNRHWKFSASDLAERGYWDDYIEAYQDALTATSTPWAPWYVIPADYKWVTRALVAKIICQRIKALDLHFPEVSPEKQQQIAQARQQLEAEQP